MSNIQPVPGMYFLALRKRDDKHFAGQIESVKNMDSKGIMVVVRLADNLNRFATVYLDECSQYAWNDFPFPCGRIPTADDMIAGW